MHLAKGKGLPILWPMTDRRVLHTYLRPLHELFEEHGHPAIAHGQQAYMKGNFPFHGIKTPERRRLMGVFTERYGPPPTDELAAIVRSAWSVDEREMHYAGMEFLASKGKELDAAWLPLAEEIILQHSWWDTVDFIAVQVVGTILLRHRDQLPVWNRRLMSGTKPWSLRTAIILQLLWKERTDERLLFRNCAALADHPDFFIRKGIGWALRHYARTSPDAVRRFVAAHQLSPLSRREALKHL